MKIKCQALPGAGKTVLVDQLRQHGIVAFDSDEFAGSEDQPVEHEDRLLFMRDIGNVDLVITSLWWHEINEAPDFVFIPEFYTWIKTCRTTRHDLLETFGESKLKSWYDDYIRVFVSGKYELSSQIKVIEMSEDEYISAHMELILNSIGK